MITEIVKAAEATADAVAAVAKEELERSELKNAPAIVDNAQAAQDEAAKDQITQDVVSQDTAAVEKDIAT